jgi:hypothetical protein
MTKNMCFSKALEEIKQGCYLQRVGWNGKNMYVELHEQKHELDLPYIKMKTADGKFVPWLASQTDILAEDWQHCNKEGELCGDDIE